MLYLGLDASTKSTGYCIMDEHKDIIKCGCFMASSTDVVKRIRKITEEIETLLKENKIAEIILEEVRPPQGDEYYSGNLQTHRVLMWLQGQINFVAHDNNVKVEYLLPSSWRKNCGIKQGGLTRESLKKKDLEWAKLTYDDHAADIINDDIADAIGVVYGYLNKNNIKPDYNWA